MPKKPIQVWIDEKLKKRVEKIFERNGLDTASAIRLFIAQVDLSGGIPLHFREDKEAAAGTWQFPWTEEEIEEAYKESLNPKNLSRPYNLPEEWEEFCADHDLKP